MLQRNYARFKFQVKGLNILKTMFSMIAKKTSK